MNPPKRLLSFFSLLLLTASGAAMALEEPEFRVVTTTDTYEIRQYEPYIVAEVDIDASTEKKASGSGFRILAGYIFGDNRQQVKMEMTAPVESRSGKGVKMKMTAPVETTAGEGDSFTYAFVMEQKYTLDTLPEPIDSRIRIREKPGRYVAALRFSGGWSEKNYARHKAELSAALADDGVAPAGEFTLARYNSPFAPPFMRRNEVLVEVSWPDAVASSEL